MTAIRIGAVLTAILGALYATLALVFPGHSVTADFTLGAGIAVVATTIAITSHWWENR